MMASFVVFGIGRGGLGWKWQQHPTRLAVFGNSSGNRSQKRQYSRVALPILASRCRKRQPQLVYEKLGHSGLVYNTESGSKLKVSLRLSPSALLVLELIGRGTMHFSVTSLYAHPAQLDGEVIGRYPGRK